MQIDVGKNLRGPVLVIRPLGTVVLTLGLLAPALNLSFIIKLELMVTWIRLIH
jgi:hypothetical protein